MKQMLVIFVTVFLAELGDKTQLATFLFATDENTKAMLVFFAAGLALLASTAVAVLLGSFAQASLANLPLELIAGIGFITIGGWMVWGHFSATI